jgi:SEC-C motif-containing protein
MTDPCPCGRPATLAECCGRYLAGVPAPDAVSLMRSRYTAFTLADEAYLLATWHPDTRPARLDLAAGPAPKWLGLKVLGQARQDDSHAIVEFVARYKIAGRAYRQHETSRFVKLAGHWYYFDGIERNG